MVGSVARSVGRLARGSTALFLCDMQVKFRPMVSHFDQIVHNSNRVISRENILGLGQ